jgi:Ras-related protein Rab-11A
MLVGNKCDLQHLRQVSRDEGQTFADKEDALFTEASALDATNVADAFQTVIREAYYSVSKNVLSSATSASASSASAASSSAPGAIGSSKVVTFHEDADVKPHPRSGKCCSA